MALISMRQLLDHAAEHGYGLPAFNVNNMEQVKAIMEAADATDSPVILQGSAGARSYAGEPFLRHLILAAVEAYPHIPVCMHQDHGASPGVCFRSIQSGFSSVMMDGSLKEDGKTPASFEYNVEVTSKVVQLAHACGVSVEGELGCLGSLETGKAGEEDGHGAEGHLVVAGEDRAEVCAARQERLERQQLLLGAAVSAERVWTVMTAVLLVTATIAAPTSPSPCTRRMLFWAPQMRSR